MISKVLHVAKREFVTTATTKAFILGAFVVPALMFGIMFVGFKYLLKDEVPAVEGRLALVDRSGAVSDGVAARLQPEAIRARNRDVGREAAAKMQEKGGDLGAMAGAAAQSKIEEVPVPKLTIVTFADGADVEAEKDSLRTPDAGADDRLALAVIDASAAAPDSLGNYGSFQLFVRADLDDRVVDEIRGALTGAVKEARIRGAGLDPVAFGALSDVEAPRTMEVSPQGERTSLGDDRVVVSFGFMAVLMISVLLGGQSLLTTTVEEKSNRVVEVLLSALSPMELMAGKVLGQLGVGLAVLLVYGTLGGGALVLWGLGYMLGPLSLTGLIVFFLIAYVMIGSLLAAVGSAVNDMREAQSLQTPIMIFMMIPYLLWLPISRDPNGVFATACSFVPPVNAFVMMLRITSTEPPPVWQVAASIAVGLGGVLASMWIAAKVFRIGLLMYGKPPNFATLVRWARMA